MRASLGLCVLAASFFLGGCATSLRQVAPEKDCVFDPSVLGTWTATDEDGQSTAIKWEKKVPDGYLISFTPTGKDYRVAYAVRLFRLGTTLFYDAAADRVTVRGEDLDVEDLGVAPRHMIGKIQIRPDEIRTTALDAHWMQKALEEKRVSLKFEKMSSELWPDILLTGPPGEIRAFLEKYADDKGAFPDELVIKRQK